MVLTGRATALPFHRTEGGEADVLVKNFDLGEPDVTQQIELEQERAGRVLLLDVGEHMVPVGFVLEPGQVLPVVTTHELPDRRDRTSDRLGRAR